MTIAGDERDILLQLEGRVFVSPVRALIDPIVERVAQKLARDPSAVMAWEPVPLTVYGGGLPEMIRSSWVFILRAGATTGAERHPNSHQRAMSYRGCGAFEVWVNDQWHSHPLVSIPDGPIESRWVSIPAGTWHQVVVPDQDWVVVSFHTVFDDELIEERPDPDDPVSTRRKLYVGTNTDRLQDM
jgi:hypothetical protein